MNYRLLNQGEIIQEGDEIFHAGDFSWHSYGMGMGTVYGYGTPMRRPIPEPQGWTPVSTPPTKGDANKQGMILWHLILSDGRHSSRVAPWSDPRDERIVTHWTHHLDDPSDPGEEDFRTWWQENASHSSGVDIARSAFLAGRKSVQS